MKPGFHAWVDVRSMGNPQCLRVNRLEWVSLQGAEILCTVATTEVFLGVEVSELWKKLSPSSQRRNEKPCAIHCVRNCGRAAHRGFSRAPSVMAGLLNLWKALSAVHMMLTGEYCPPASGMAHQQAAGLCRLWTVTSRIGANGFCGAHCILRSWCALAFSLFPAATDVWCSIWNEIGKC